MATPKYTYAVGRRKSATAQVKLFAGKGESTINNKSFKKYVSRPDLFDPLFAPLKAVNAKDDFFFEAEVVGSGDSSQVGAIVLGIARALQDINPEYTKSLRDGGFLTRDARRVERKKPGLHKARKRIQWSKR